MKHESTIRKRSPERHAAWEILRTSPTVRMLAALAGPYGPQPTASLIAKANDDLAEQQVRFAETTRHHAPARSRSRVARRVSLLEDALDDTFPATHPPAIVAPVYGGWR
jgi:hypothetical protein